MWPTRPSDPFTDRINALPKHVASRTLQQTDWNATLIEGDVAERVAELKRQPGGDILKFGTGGLDRTLLEHGLIDELHLWVFPVIAGSGERLLDGIDTTHLKLLEDDDVRVGHRRPRLRAGELTARFVVVSSAQAGGERPAELLAGADAELGEDLAQVVLDGARADEQLRADLRVRVPVGAMRAICASWGVRTSRVSAVRRGTVSPVAESSRRARSANASAPARLNVSCAARSCSRASTRRSSRRSHSP